MVIKALKGSRYLYHLMDSKIRTQIVNPDHSIYIRRVSSYCMFSALLNWFELVDEPFDQSNMHCTLSVSNVVERCGRASVKF